MTGVVSDTRLKAAMIVRLLQAEGAPIALSSLPEEVQIDLTRSLGAMKPVSRATRDQVAEEFAAALEDLALTAPAGFRGALDSLEGQISSQAAARLTEEAARGDPAHAWARLAALDPAAQERLMTREGAEIAALYLSKLPVPKAADLLTRLPGPRAREIACTSALLDDMGQPVAARIAHALVDSYCIRRELALDKAAVQRVAAMLDATGRDRREEILTGLDEDDPDFARAVRKAIFVFANLPQRLAPTDVPKVLRLVNTEQLVPCIGGARARGGADEQAAAFLLENVPGRMAEQIEDEIAEAGRLRASDIDEAQGALIKAIRDLADGGEITLITEEDDDSSAEAA